MALRRLKDGTLDLRLYLDPTNSKAFQYFVLLEDYDYEAYKGATDGERKKISLFINKNANSTIKEIFSNTIKGFVKRAEEELAQTSSSIPSSDPVEQLSSTVAKLSLVSEPQPSISIIPQPSKTLILSSSSSSVEIDPTTMEDKDLFPLIRGTVDREERRRLMFSMSHEQQVRFISWNEELAAKKEKLRLLQEEQRRIEAEQARLRQNMSNTLSTGGEQSYHEITSSSKKITPLNNGY